MIWLNRAFPFLTINKIIEELSNLNHKFNLSNRDKGKNITLLWIGKVSSEFTCYMD